MQIKTILATSSLIGVMLFAQQSFADSCERIDSAETFHKNGAAFLRINPRPHLNTFHLESFHTIKIGIDSNKPYPCFFIIGNYLQINTPTTHSAKDWEIAIRKALEGAYMERMRDNSPYRSYPVPQYRGRLDE